MLLSTRLALVAESWQHQANQVLEYLRFEYHAMSILKVSSLCTLILASSSVVTQYPQGERQGLQLFSKGQFYRRTF